MLMQSHGATVILSRPLRIPFVLEIARRCRSFSYSFLRDGLPVIDIGVDSEPAHDVALFNCPDAHERIRDHPELATVSLLLFPEESTHVYREGSEAIQYPCPRSHSR